MEIKREIDLSVNNGNYYSGTLVVCLILILDLFQIFIGFNQIGSRPYGQNWATGSFYNSGPFACYLAVNFPIILYAGVHSNIKYLRCSGIFITLINIFFIFSSASRTAIIALSFGIIFVFYEKINQIYRRNKLLLLICCITLTACFILCICCIKQHSSIGRLFIWKIAFKLVCDVPLTGIGWKNVPGAYGDTQEQYFALGNGTELEKLLADAPEYVFNEYLQVAIAFGIMTSILLILILCNGLIASIRNQNYGYAGSIAAVFIVMCASYPLQFSIFAITICIILCAAFLYSKIKWLSLLGFAVTILSCTMFLTNNDKIDVTKYFVEARSLNRIGKYKESNEHLQYLKQYSSDPMILNIIGKNFEALKCSDSAEYYYRKSVNRCPNRLYPHYLLMLLYKDSTNFGRDALLNEANILVNMTEKIPSPAVEKMKLEARKVLCNFEYENNVK